ncbi:MAG: hypothetical protein JRJ20_10550 [Deltaproteobacteria bacterium]|nr:hypothetical protein [Deltaproteobacteria bacterium]
MRRKKKPKTKKPLQPTVLTPEEKSSVTSILKKFDNADPAELVAMLPDARHAQAIIDQVCMGKAPSVPLLLALKDGFEDKRVHKAVKRALFKLRQKGISVEEYLKPEGTPSLILKAPQKEKPAAYVGPVLNMFGSRAVLITHFRGTKSRHMGMGIASDEEGIHEFLYGIFSKKRTKEMKDLLSRCLMPPRFSNKPINSTWRTNRMSPLNILNSGPGCWKTPLSLTVLSYTTSLTRIRSRIRS